MTLLDKTLEELDGQDWGEPTYQSGLVIDCHRLRRVPLRDFTTDNLRRLIGQKMSLDYLVPLALARLMDDPFQGELYSGDLVNGLLKLPPDFWKGHPDLARGLNVVVTKAQGLLESQPDLAGEVDEALVEVLTQSLAELKPRRQPPGKTAMQMIQGQWPGDETTAHLLAQLKSLG